MSEYRSLTLFDDTGDTTIAWTADKDAELCKVIEQKMSEGVQFFIVKPRFGKVLGKVFGDKKIKINSVNEAVDRKVTVSDNDFLKIMGVKEVPSKSDEAQISVTKRSTDAHEIASNHSIGTSPIRAG